MPTALAELLATHGVVRRRVLHKAGVPRRVIRRLLADGSLVLLAPDVLAAPGEPPIGRELAAAAAALDGVVSGASAALRWGWALVGEPTQHQVTVPRHRGGRELARVRVRRRDLGDDEWVERDGVRVTTPLRTALDCARDLSLREAVVALDSALRAKSVTLDELCDALAALPAGPGRRRVAAVVDLLDPRSGSVLESLCRLVLVQAGLPPEATQLTIRNGRAVIGRFDFAWPGVRLVVEVDGFEFHSDRARYRKDRRRATALGRAGWTVLRFSWEDVVGSPEWVIDSVRQALGPCQRCAA